MNFVLGGRRGGGGWVWKIRSFLNQKVDGNMILIDYWNVLVLNFSGMGNTVFFETKSENIIFTDYWNVLVLNFSGMENLASFWGKKLMQRWYLPVTELLFWAFPLWEIRFFGGKKVMERWYLLITEKFLFWATKKFLIWAFWWWEIRSFLAKKLT